MLRLRNIVAGVVSLAILIGSVGGFVVVKWFDGSIDRIHLSLGQDRPASAAYGSQNWLLVGTDSRAGSTGEFGYVPGERSDTTILSHLDRDGTTTNISIPRDTLVTIPEYRNSKGKIVKAHKDKFNSSLLDGGPSLLVRTVEAMFNVRVDHYVSVDLEGLAKIASAINGVPVCILKSDYTETGPDGGTITNINDGYSNFHGKYGEQTLVGEQAVAFVRQRHGLPDSDLSRIRRQQQFLGSVFRTAFRVNLLFNPVRVTRLLSAIKDALTLDDDTSLTDLEKLGLRLRGVDPSQMIFETVPTHPITFQDTNLGTLFGNPNAPSLIPTGQTEDVGNVLLLNQNAFDDLVAKVTGDSNPDPSPGAPAAPTRKTMRVTVDPSKVQVTVQDGVGQTGLADQVTEALKAERFRTGAPGPAYSFGHTQSEVRYAPAHAEAARTVAAAVPGSVLKKDPSVTNGVVLVVGANYSTVLPVIVSTAPTPTTPSVTEPTPTPTSRATVPPVTAASQGNRCTY